MIIELLINYCIKHNYISTLEAPMLRYCLQKKIYTFLITIPICIMGIKLSDCRTTFSFLGTFYFLRSTTNGYHAKTVLGCFAGSIFLVFIVLKFINPILSFALAIPIVLFCSILICLLAPYNHSNIDLSPEEIIACRNCAKKRLCIILLFLAISFLASERRVFYGTTLGITLVTGLLGFAYIIKWRNQYDQIEKNGTTDSVRCTEND